MKKLFGLIMVLFIAIALTACGKEETKDTANTTDTPAEKSDQVKEDVVKEEDKGIFASIKDAVDKSIPLKCTYTDPEGVSMTMYIKGNVMRADAIQSSPTDPLIHEIIKDNKVYIWSDQSAQGMAIDFAKMQPTDDSMTMGETPIHSTDDIMTELDKQKQNCAREVVSDSIFDVPANIQFVGI